MKRLFEALPDEASCRDAKGIVHGLRRFEENAWPWTWCRTWNRLDVMRADPAEAITCIWCLAGVET